MAVVYTGGIACVGGNACVVVLVGDILIVIFVVVVYTICNHTAM